VKKRKKINIHLSILTGQVPYFFVYLDRIMQDNSEIGKAVLLDCSSVSPSNSLPRTEDPRIQRIRKYLFILNRIVFVSYFFFHLIKYDQNKLIFILRQRLIYSSIKFLFSLILNN